MREIATSDTLKGVDSFKAPYEFDDSKEPPQDAPNDTTALYKTRYTFGILGLLGVAVLYALRVNLSIAIVTMVNITALEEIEEDRRLLAVNITNFLNATDPGDVCPGKAIEPETADSGEFLWSEEKQGMILSGFFYGYAIGQLPGGVLAEWYGGKLVFGLGTFFTALLTVVSPFCAWLHEDLFFAVRLLEGLAEGVTFPAIQFMISKWAPPSERSRFSMIFCGSYVGTVICMPISGYLCSLNFAGGWPMVFYVFGVLGIIWYCCWVALVYDSPGEHPWISEEEKKFIQNSLGYKNTGKSKKKRPIPWGKILKTPGLWACSLMHVGIGWNFFGQITYIPTYMAAILHYKIRNNAFLSTIPYITGGIFSILCNVVLDILIKRKLVRPITGFRIFNGITGLGAAVTILLVTWVGCDRTWINILLALNGICLGAQYAGNGMNLLVLAPNFSGTLYGISNTFANVAGILAPVTVGILTNNNQTKGQWNIMFMLSAVIAIVSFGVYLLMGTDEVQPYNFPEDEQGTKKGKDVDDKDEKGYVNEGFVKDSEHHL